MQDLVLKVKRINSLAKLPDKAYKGDLGYDLFSVENVIIHPHQIAKVRTGIIMEFPENYGGIIKDRSSLAAKGIVTAAGVIDSGYRGEIIVVLINLSNEPYEIKIGDKIAQLLLFPVVSPKIIEVSEVSNTIRSNKGFGSSGR